MACVPFFAGSRDRAAGNSAGTFPGSPVRTGTSRVRRSRARSPARGLKDGAGPRKVTRSPSGGQARASPVTSSHAYPGGALSHEVLVPGLSGSGLLAGAGPGSRVRRPGRGDAGGGGIGRQRSAQPWRRLRACPGHGRARRRRRGPPPGSGPQPSAYFVIDCLDLDAALGWAARIPAASYGTAEARSAPDNYGRPARRAWGSRAAARGTSPGWGLPPCAIAGRAGRSSGRARIAIRATARANAVAAAAKVRAVVRPEDRARS
jgi:hypothetical protein